MTFSRRAICGYEDCGRSIQVEDDDELLALCEFVELAKREGWELVEGMRPANRPGYMPSIDTALWCCPECVAKMKKETLPMNTEDQTESEIQALGLTAPRVTPAMVDAAIKETDYTLLQDGRSTICLITLDNGFTVRGESSCVSRENYNADIGNKIAFDDARSKVWQLLAFRLADQRMRSEVRVHDLEVLPGSDEATKEFAAHLSKALEQTLIPPLPEPTLPIDCQGGPPIATTTVSGVAFIPGGIVP